MGSAASGRRVGRPGLPVVNDVQPDGGGPPRSRRSPKLSEEIAGELVRSIVSGGLGVGDHLASEALMLEQLGVGRESLREALRLLEAQGLITIKRGPGGGPVVAGVDPRYLARTASMFFHLGGVRYDEVLEAWQVLEPPLAAQLARRPVRGAVVRALAPYLGVPGDAEDHHVAKDTGFHTALAQLSGSRVMLMLLQSLSHMVVDHVAETLDHLEDWEDVEREHAAIAEAILDGRAVLAQRLMEKHIEGVRDSCRRRWPDRLLDLVEWT